MKKFLRSSVSSLIFYGGRLFGGKSSGVRILCYHRVHPVRNGTSRAHSSAPDEFSKVAKLGKTSQQSPISNGVNDKVSGYLSVSAASFREQMDYLVSEGYQTISLNELIAGKGSPKSVVIAFDDGYRDNFENAFPVLAERGFKATIFCVTQRLGTKDYLELNEIFEMKRAGFSFGSHTNEHPHLPRLLREEKQREISDSKKILEEMLDFPVSFFCYPYGEYDQETVELVREAGYQGACSNIPGSNRKIDPYLLERTEISPSDTIFDFQKKLAGAYDLVHRGLHLVRGKP